MSLADRAVLVTGAAGFIGRRVGTLLHEAGRPVVGTDVVAPRPVLPFEFHVADARDVARHADVLARGCDAVVHCGGISGPMVMQDNPAELLDINIRGTTQLLSLASTFGVRRFVCLSSVSAYGDTPGADVVTEDRLFRASSFYGTSKAATDLIVQSYAASGGLSAVALRLGWVYGPGRTTDALIQSIVRSARGAPFRLRSGRDHLVQFVHVEDVASAVVAALDVPAAPQVAYNVNGAEAVTVGEVRDMIAAQLPEVDAEIGPGLLEGTDVQGVMSIEAAARDLGWRPAIAFDRGLRDYVDWLRDHPF